MDKNIFQKRFVKWILIPSMVYFLAWVGFTWPLLTTFNTHLWAGETDGLQNYWNLWWVGEAISNHQSIWHTNLLFYPFGTSLYTHALTATNGYIAYGLELTGLNLLQIYNLLTIIGFVGTGLAMMGLTHFLVKNRMAALWGGFAVTFSAFHFAHAHEHLEFVSLYFLPLTIWLTLKYVKNPKWWLVIAVPLSWWATLLNTAYLFLDAVVLAAPLTVWLLVNHRHNFLVKKTGLKHVILMGLLILTVGRQVVLIQQAASTEKWGGHAPQDYSLNLLAPFVPGENWRFASLTKAYWSQINGGFMETGTYLTWSLMILAVYGFIISKKSGFPRKLFLGIIISVFIFGMGPYLNILDHRYYWTRADGLFKTLPYGWLVTLWPGLALSGMPMRMFIVITISMALLSAVAVKQRKQLLPLIMMVYIVEVFPRPQSTTQLNQPAFVSWLVTQPEGAVLDLTHEDWWQMYYQTLHGKPLTKGYISRTAETTSKRLTTLQEAVRLGNWWTVKQAYQVGYVVTSAEGIEKGLIKPSYIDTEHAVYRLNDTGELGYIDDYVN